ncbi:protein MMS22-like [Anabrus simplex]|uniref:protein MMS22-like n=1 Tax=Anabrus simplex TaxID=316456 RepID=UPI0035A3B352
MLKEIAPEILKNLESLRLLVKKLSSLPGYILNLSSNTQGNQSPHATYHLLHLQLDMYWYQLTILHFLEEFSHLKGELEESLSTVSQQLEHLIRLLLTDLFNIALMRFEKLSLCNLRKKSPFACSCVKELWLLLQIYIDQRSKKTQGNIKAAQEEWLPSKCLEIEELQERHDSFNLHKRIKEMMGMNGKHVTSLLVDKNDRLVTNPANKLWKAYIEQLFEGARPEQHGVFEADTGPNILQEEDFWHHVNQLLAEVKNKSSANKISTTDCSSLAVPDDFPCTNPIGFSLWMLVHIANLYGYTERGDYEGAHCSRMVANYHQLEKILKVAISPESSMSEAQLREYIPLVSELVTQLWPPRTEPVVLLWQYFHQRLNSCFFLHGAAPDSVAVISKSGASLMKKVTGYVDGSNLEAANSFELFLHLLGVYLQQNPAHWQQVKGRIYSKFFPAKMQALREIGIYHVCSLFLTLAITVDIKEAGNKMQELMQVLLAGNLEVPKRLMVWKSHLALVQLHILKGVDITEASKPLLKDVMMVNTAHQNHETTVLLGTFIEGFRDIIISSETLELSQYAFIDSWISHILFNSSDPRLLLDVLLMASTKVLEISQQVGMIEYDSNHSHLTLMYQALCENVLPFLKLRFESSETKEYYSQLADLAESLTLLALNRANVGVNTQPFTNFFQTFVLNASPMNTKLIIRYMNNLLKRQSIISELAEAYSNYEVIIIQAWFRCVVYSVDEESPDLQNLTQIVCHLPALIAISESTSIILDNERDPMLTFVRMLGQAYYSLDTNQHSTNLREQFAQYLYTSVQNFKPVLQNRNVSESIVLRICQLAASLMVHCGPIIYTRSNPSCIFNMIKSHLLLPMELFKPETQLHPYLANALRRTFHLFIRGIAHINAANGNILNNIFRDLIVQYFTRLLRKAGPNVKSQSHPLMLCFRDSEDQAIGKLVLETVTKSFVKITVNQSASLALMFILDLLCQKKYSEEMVGLVVNCSLKSILEIVIFGSSSHPVLKRQALNILNESFINRICGSPHLRCEFESNVLAVSRQYFPQHGSHVLVMLNKLCELAPSVMITTLPKIEEIVDLLGHSRNQDFRAIMRRGLDNLKKILGLQENLQKT